MDREDGLPDPSTVTDLYLAAVLDELRALRKERPQQSQQSLYPQGTRVKEKKDK